MKAQGPTVHHQDAYWMRRALCLAERQAGRTWPNPTVGACFVREGRLLAEASHAGAGELHAEAAALAKLEAQGVDPAGATVYVTLEPCHHQGRTPPCSRALAEARVARVVYAIDDRSPRHDGGGGAWLSDHGIVVERGLLGAVAWELNHPFFETTTDDEIHFTLKLALTLDGKMAPRTGRIEDPRRRRVTGDRVARRVHRMRSRSNAVLVGRRTVEFDRPRLDVRLASGAGSRDPRPVVLDPECRLDPDWLPANALVLHGPSAPATAAGSGYEFASVDQTEPGRLALDGVESALRERGLGVVLVEAGPTLAAELVAVARPHRIHLFLAPRTFGPEALAFPELSGLQERYRGFRQRGVGEDLEWVLRRDDLPCPF